MNLIQHSFVKPALSVAIVMLSTAATVQAALFEEVIVTAQKREQGLQEVSIAVTAFSGDQLDALGANTANDLIKYVPNVEFETNGPNSNFVVRGVSLVDFGDGNESPVGFYIDEVYKGTLAGQTAQLFDIERVEVLRGPQGTLFGRNTTGGLFHVVTRKPTDEFEFYGNLQYGDNDTVIVDGAVSGALSDKVRGRFAFKSNTDDGWQTNQVNGNKFGVNDVWAVRGALEIDLSDEATLLLSVSGSEQDNTAPGYGHRGNTDINTFAPCSDAEIGAQAANCVTIGGLQPEFNPEKIVSDADELANNVDIFNVSATLTWNLNADLTLSSITSYGTVERFYQEDASGPTSTSGFLPPAAFIANYAVDATQFTQEIRLNGSSDKTNWVVGGFYYDDEKDDASTSLINIGELLTDFTLDSQSWAVFGQLEYDLSEQLTLITGLRYTQDEKSLQVNATPVPGFSFSTSPELDTDAFTWKVGLDWNLNEDTLLYMSVSKGFKSGAFNASFLGSPEDAAPVGEEELLSYEMGWKATMLDGLARFNGAFFYSDYTDLQGIELESINGTAVTRLNSLGDAEIYGAEMEFVVSPVDAMDIMLTAGWINTELKANPGIPFNGNELSGSPKLNISAIGLYTADMGSRGSVTTQLSANWRDNFYTNLDNTPSLEQDSFVLLGARLSWVSADDKFSAAVFGDNLTDEEYFSTGFQIEGLAQSVIWNRTRTWGVEVGYRY